MSDIQRYVASAQMHPSDDDDSDATFVTYADHVEALRQAEARGKRSAPATCVQAYDEGQRDALAAAVQRVEALAVRRGGSDGSPARMLYDSEVIAAIKGDNDGSV